MARINHIRHPDLAVICLPVALLGNPLLLAAAVGRGIVAAGTLRIAGILLGLGGIALVVRLRGIGRLVILLLGVIGLLVLAVGFFLLLGLGFQRFAPPFLRLASFCLYSLPLWRPFP